MVERLFSKKSLAKIREFNMFDISKQFNNHVGLLWFQLYSSEFMGKIKPNLNMHRHTFYEIHFIIKGSLSYITSENKVLSAKKGEYIFIPPKIEHQRSVESEDLKKAVLAFSVIDKESTFYHFPAEAFVSNECEWFEYIFGLLTIALESDNGNTSQLMGSILSSLVILLAESVEIKDVKQKVIYKDDRLVKAKRFIADNSFRNLSVSEVADFVYLSVKQLERLFAEYEHIKVYDYIAKARCDVAKTLLVRDELTIAQVASQLEFSNVYNFTRFFKKVEGITPGAYKKVKSNRED